MGVCEVIEQCSGPSPDGVKMVALIWGGFGLVLILLGLYFSGKKK